MMTATILTILRRRSIFILFFLSLFLIAAYPVWAKDASSGGVTTRIETKKAALQERMETKKENLAQRLEDKKVAIASREATLKARLDAFKDKRKAEVAQKVNTNLNRINEKHTSMMLKFLDNASKILAKLETRVNENTSDIKNVDATRAAISEAKAKIASAEAAVTTQSQNDYTITVTSESTVKKDAQTMREKLHNDLKAVRELVREAKQAVANAIMTAKTGRAEKVKEGIEGGQ